MATTRFSIIIAFYNHRAFIKEALDSALSIDYAEKEIIAVDDASTDGSQEILRQYGDRVRLVALETNQGACAARNHGAALATGDYLVFLDGDDTFLPWALNVYERVVRAKKPKMILGSVWWFKGALPTLQEGDIPHEIRVVEYEDYLQRDRPLQNTASALVIDRQSFEDIHGWTTDFFPSEDHDIALRLGIAGRCVLILSPPTTFHRAHASFMVKHLSGCLTAVHRLIQKETRGGYPGGQGRRRERHALIGGVVLFFVKRAAQSRLYLDAIKLFARGWPMVFAAVSRKLSVRLRGRQPCETINL